MKKETSPGEYWAAIAEEVGEPVRAFALARLLGIGGPEQTGVFSARPEWGLVFITDSTLYIERGSSQGWLQRLVTNSPVQKTQERNTIPIESMTEIVISPPKTGLRRILAAPETVVDIHYTGTPGGVRLVLDRRGDNDKRLIDILSGLKNA